MSVPAGANGDAAGGGGPAATDYAPPSMLVLFGSQSGTAEDVAERIAREAERLRFRASVSAMDDWDLERLPEERVVIFVAATTGQGDTPDNMKVFWRNLLRRGLPSDFLEGVSFAVFGLGDSSYQRYNVVGKKLDARLAQLGAERVLAKGLGDDQHPRGYEGDLDPWLESLWAKLGELFPAPPGFEPGSAAAKPPPRHRVEILPPGTPTDDPHPSARPPPGRTWSKEHPYHASVAVNRRLTSPDNEQDVRHLEIDLGDSGITYEPGDVVAIQPLNRPEIVSDFLATIGADPATVIRFWPPPPVSAHGAPAAPAGPVTATLAEVASRHLDIGSSPRRSFFELLCHFAAEEREAERLQYFLSSEGRDDLFSYNQRSKRTIAEVFRDFPSCRPPLDYLLDLVPRIRPRLFSISSSPRDQPGRLHVTAAVVKYTTPVKLERWGVCTSYLCRIRPGDKVAIWIREGTIRLPQDPSAPIIMVGPGTGCAPFRAFLQHRRRLRDEEGAAIGPAILFFGCRYQAKDFLYAEEWAALGEAGALTQLRVAFSRDQPHKVYVQHRIAESAAELWPLLSDPRCCVYVAGSAKSMPADVAESFREVARSAGAMGEAEAAEWLRKMEQARRFQLDTWS
eukprot:tig00000475_g1252.t1